MLRLPSRPLPAEALSGLNTLQTAVDGAGNYAACIAEGKRLFDKHNKPKDKIFSAVRAELALISANVLRCCYCELSEIDQVEHVFPKDLFPQMCFTWDNYLYACGPCNRRKSNKWWTFDGVTGVASEFTRPRGTPPLPPPPNPLFISPRIDNPLDFLFLDTLDTFEFAPSDDHPGQTRYRAEKTILMLDLNREPVRKARENAFFAYARILESYVAAKDTGNVQTMSANRTGLLSQPHPTVWEFMKMHRIFHDQLKEMFERAPEALGWSVI